MGELKGKSGPPGNMNAFKHGLAAIQKRQKESVLPSRRRLSGSRFLKADIGGGQVSTATKILAEVIASDAAWLMVFNSAIEHIIQNNPKARQNPTGLSQLDGLRQHRHDISGARCA